MNNKTVLRSVPQCLKTILQRLYSHLRHFASSCPATDVTTSVLSKQMMPQ